jgi:diadenosine tetraphosphate (Ap4A) HIT family hydrolase
MVITESNYRKWSLRYWLAEPTIEPAPEGYVCIDITRPSFPDLKDLTPKQRKKFIKVLRKHPEYLHEIQCERTVQ